MGKVARKGFCAHSRITSARGSLLLGIFPVVTALEGWFGIRVWIGQDAQFAAATAALLVLGTAPLLLNSIVDVTAKVVEMPEIEAWYLGTGVAINLACTIPLALRIGVIGIPLGTAIGQVISFFVCIYLARKKIGKEITPFFWYIRYFPALVAVAIAGACEWVFRNSLPGGGVGFVLSGLLTVPAFITYYGWVYRDLLLKRLGIRVQAAEGRKGEIEHDDNDYAGRQLREVQALLALAEPEVTSSFAGRQLKGLQALLALAEPEMTVGLFSESSYRLRYTGPQKQLDERLLYLPP